MIVELYRFVIGTQVYAYTTAQQPVSYESDEYEPIYIKRDPIKATEEIARSNVNIRVPRDAAVTTNFIGGAPATVVEVDIFQQNDVGTVVIWTGRVLSVNWSGSEAIMNCEPIYTSLKRTGLHARYQKMCRHALYDAGCTVNKNDYRVTATLTARTDLTLTADAFGAKPDGWFTAGYVESGTVIQRRAIVGHASNTITLASPLLDTEVGDQVVAFAGCAHNRNACDTKFNNIINYGGMPYIPRKNPFGSDPVF